MNKTPNPETSPGDGPLQKPARCIGGNVLAGIRRISDRAGQAAATLAIFMAALTVLDVAGRTLMASPLRGGIEIQKILLAVFGYGGLARACRNGADIRIGVADRLWRGRWTSFISVLSRLPGILIAVLLSLQAGKQVPLEYARGAATDSLGIPSWPLYAFLSLCAALLCLSMGAELIASVASPGASSPGAPSFGATSNDPALPETN